MIGRKHVLAIMDHLLWIDTNRWHHRVYGPCVLIPIRRAIERDVFHLHHPSMPTIYETYTKDNSTWLLIAAPEHMLSDMKLTWPEIGVVLTQVSEAIHFLHEHEVIHFNITPFHIGVYKKGDSFQCTWLDLSQCEYISTVSTPSFHDSLQRYDIIKTLLWYRSYELLSHLPVSFETDVWSLGCLLYELITHRRLFEGLESYSDYNHNVIYHGMVLIKQLEKEKTPFATYIISILSRCVERDPSLRITTTEIISLLHAL